MSLKESLISDIKRKKELSLLDDDFISELIDEYFSRNNKIKNQLEKHPKPQKSRSYKLVIKDLRKILHEAYGVFQLGKRGKLLERLNDLAEREKKIDDELINIHEEILKTHRSTKERLNDYRHIYKKILNKKVKSILDISSGLNALSYPWMNLKKVNYYATELSKKDCEFLEEYFKAMKKFGLNGKAIKMNLLKAMDFPQADICFLFKVLDTFEGLKRGISREILKSLNSKTIVVSFPTKTLSGKNLSKKRLVWFEKLVKNYEIFETENEIFYIIKLLNG